MKLKHPENSAEQNLNQLKTKKCLLDMNLYAVELSRLIPLLVCVQRFPQAPSADENHCTVM